MAKGLEVLQAALAGKRVRFLQGEKGVSYLGADQKWSGWMDFGGLQAWGITELFAFEWQIEERTLTFEHVDKAMIEGRIGERTPRNERWDTVQYRVRHGSYEMRFRGPDESWCPWQETMLGDDDIHATDWHIVTEATLDGTSDERPTFLEFTEHFRNDDWIPRDAWKALYGSLNSAAAKWPGAFRQETP